MDGIIRVQKGDGPPAAALQYSAHTQINTHTHKLQLSLSCEFRMVRREALSALEQFNLKKSCFHTRMAPVNTAFFY